MKKTIIFNPFLIYHGISLSQKYRYFLTQILDAYNMKKGIKAYIKWNTLIFQALGMWACSI